MRSTSKLLCRSLLLAVAGALAIASSALASTQCVPSPVTSTTPSTIRLVGSHGGAADEAGTYTVTVRNIAMDVAQNASVVLDFSEAADAGAIRLSMHQQPGTTIDCATHTVRLQSGPDGVASFRVIGAARNRGATPAPATLHVKVYADGVLLGTPILAAFDEDSEQGVAPNDMSAWAGDLFSSSYWSRSDFNGDGVLNGLDLSRLADVFFRGGSSDVNAAWCP
jgi:hypothetical protein